MERLRAGTLVPLVVSVLFAAACDGTTDEGPNSAGSSPRPTTTPTCPNHDAVISDASFEKPGSLAGDVDGDGSEDKVKLALDESGPEGCRAFVIVDSGDAVHALGIEQDGMTFDLNLPQLRSLAEIDARAGAEIVVDLVAGASTQFAAAFTMGRGALERLEIAGGVASADLFAYGGSVGHLDGVDCAPDDEIVVTTAVPRGVRYLVKRRFLVLDEGEFRTTRTERARAPFEGLAERYPELAAAPFATCPSA